MKGGHLQILIFCSLLLLINHVQCLLNTNASAKIKSNDLQNPMRVLVDDSGSKFVTWNNMSKYQIYNKNGKIRCSGSLNSPISRAIWPSNYNLLLLVFPGKNIYRIQDQYCTQIKQYNFTDQVHEMTFTWRNQLPILLVSNYKSNFQQFNLNTFSNIKTFLSTAFIVDKALSAIYLNDGSSFYGQQIYNNSLRLEMFDTSLGMGYASLQLGYTLTGMTMMKNGKDIMCLATAINGSQTSVIRITTNLGINTVVERQRLSMTVGMKQDNYMVLIKSISTEIQLINTKDGQSKQTVQYFQNSTFIQDCHYKNQTIVLLDDQGNIVTADYMSTPQPDPVPIPKPSGLALWEVVLIGVGGVVVLGVLLMFIFRKRLPRKLKKCLPKWFTGEETSQSLLSSQQKIEPYIEPFLGNNNSNKVNKNNKNIIGNKNNQHIKPPPHHNNNQRPQSFHSDNGINQQQQQHSDAQSQQQQSFIIDINNILPINNPPLQSGISNHHQGSFIVNNLVQQQADNIEPAMQIDDEEQLPDDIKMARLAQNNRSIINNDSSQINNILNNNNMHNYHLQQIHQQRLRQRQNRQQLVEQQKQKYQQNNQQKPNYNHNHQPQRNSLQQPQGYLGEDSDQTNFFVVKR